MIHRLRHWLRRCRQEIEQRRMNSGGPALKTLLFHGVHEGEKPPPEVDPSLSMSLSWIEHCLVETQQQGFQFISASDLPRSLCSSSRLAILTLDDGYANNRLLLPLLHRLQIPALLFVTTDAMQRQRSYWWDVLARESVNDRRISEKRRALKKLRPAEIEAALLREFGDACLAPRGDHDRPMTAQEVSDFARDPLISIGNHTHRHALLDQLGEIEIEEELKTCQVLLTELLDQAPTILAYPNGRWNTSIARVASSQGLQFAFTTERALSPLPLDSSRHFSIPRLQPMP